MTILRKLGTFISLYLVLTSSAQTSTFQWAKSYSNINIIHSTVDAEGNVYQAASYSGTIDLDPGAGNVNVTATSSFYDFFVTKLNSQGEFVWGYSFNGNSFTTSANDLICDENAVYITGIYRGTVDFDPSSATVNKTSTGTNMYILKLNLDGEFQWVNTYEGEAVPADLKLDNNGDLVCTGSFDGSVDFDLGTGTSVLTAAGAYADAFVLKLDVNSNYIWAISINSTLSVVRAICFDEDNNYIFGGYYQGTADLDAGTAATLVSAVSASDIFLAKYDEDASFIWGKASGTSGSELINDVACNSNNDIYITGEFYNSLDLNFSGGVNNVVSAGQVDAFVARYDENANYLWSHSYGSVDMEAGRGLAVDRNDYLYVLGDFQVGIDLDPSSTKYELVSSGYDLFVAVYDPNNNLEWGGRMGGQYTDRADGISIGPDDNLYISGRFQSSADADPTNSTFNVSGSGTYSGLITKLDQCLVSYTQLTETSCGPYISPSGKLVNKSILFSDTVAKAKGCDSIILIDLTVINTDTGVSQNGRTLEAKQNGAAYQWVDCNKGYMPISGATGQSFTPTASGTYAVEITNSSCILFSNCYVIDFLSVTDLDHNDASIYPSPFNDILHIEARNGELLQITNSEGVIVREILSSGNEIIDLDLSHLSSGLYLVKRFTNDTMSVSRIIKL